MEDIIVLIVCLVIGRLGEEAKCNLNFVPEAPTFRRSPEEAAQNVTIFPMSVISLTDSLMSMQVIMGTIN